MKDALDYELMFISYHEASHTIVALHNFLEVFNVNVGAHDAKVRKDRDGQTNYNITSYTNMESVELKNTLFMHVLQTTYAGLLGERILYKDICGAPKLPPNLCIGLSGDIKDASNIIRNNNLAEPGKETAAFKKNIYRKTEKILLDHWYAVKLVAHTLHRDRKLNFDELKFLLTRKTENKDFWKDRFNKIKQIHIYEGDNAPMEHVVKKIILDK